MGLIILYIISTCVLLLSELLRTKKSNFWGQDKLIFFTAELAHHHLLGVQMDWKPNLQQKSIYGRILIMLKKNLTIKIVTSAVLLSGDRRRQRRFDHNLFFRILV